MVIVIGNVSVNPDSLEQAMQLSLQHVNRSRQEPGCLEHGVHIDAEDPCRLVFVERWETMGDLEQHFQVPESAAFINALAEMASIPPKMSMFESDEVRRH
jgi:quinol monooxygenase YgiN